LWRVPKRHSDRSKRKGNILVWVLLSVLLVCLVLWAYTGATAWLLIAFLASLGVLYMVLFRDL
jgi:hypothetical protein